MQVNIRVEIPDPEQTLELDDGLTDDEINDAVAEFAADHAAQTHVFEWHKDDDY